MRGVYRVRRLSLELGLSGGRANLLYYITRSYNQEEKHCSVNKTSQYIVYIEVYFPLLLVLHVHSHSQKSRHPHEQTHKTTLRLTLCCLHLSCLNLSRLNCQSICLYKQRHATQCNVPRSDAVYTSQNNTARSRPTSVPYYLQPRYQSIINTHTDT